ncbi:MAG: hypothetical protein JZU50_12780 [Desulfobulbaceae bacterium]|nr:hypothetical protein [Desulfobulbaceae bacterium]
MQLRTNLNLLLILILAQGLALTLTLAPARAADLPITEASDSKPAAPAPAAAQPVIQSAAVIPPTTPNLPAPPDPSQAAPGETNDLNALRQRYGHDPTGVRARLGLCGRGQGGPGCGQHRRYRGGNQWNTP